MLRITNLSAGYRKGTPVLHDLDLIVESGKALGIVGRNGAGKTCLAFTVMGVAARMKGTIEIDGTAVHALDTAARVHAGLALVPEGRLVFAQLTVTENLRVAAYGAGQSLDAGMLGSIHDRFPILKSKAEHKAGSLSGGEQQWLTIARALVQRPRVIILDEPTLGLSPVAIVNLAKALATLTAEQDLALVVMEQNPELLKTVCDDIAVLDRGEIVSHGSADDAEALIAPVVLGVG